MNPSLYKGANSNRLHSPALWADFPIGPIQVGAVDGAYFFDDWLRGWDTGTITTVANFGDYEMFAESGGSITPSTSVSSDRGAVNLVSGTTGDADTAICYGGGANFIIPTTLGTAKLVFECRLKISAVTNDANQQFIGLTIPDVTAAAALFGGSGSTTLATAMADVAYLGFVRLDGDTTDFRFVYNKAGGTDATLITSAATLAADTYVKLGFVYDTNEPDGTRRIKVYVNGSVKSTYITDAIIADTTNFPGGVAMTMAAVVAPDSTTSATTTIDWWAIGQLD